MPDATVTIRSDLTETLQERAQQGDRSLDDLVNEAVEQYLQEQQRRKIDREILAYHRLHPDLWRTMANQWLAVHNGEVVDQDSDRQALYRRIRAKYGRTSVLIRQVKWDAEEEFWLKTPSTGRTDA